MEAWIARIGDYLDQLEQTVGAIDEFLQKTDVDTSAGNPDELEQSTARLTSMLAELESKIGERSELLRADDAPPEGNTLAQKLRQCPDTLAAALAERCDLLGRRISLVHQRSISTFVCQYHLAEFSGELVRLIAGEEPQATYDTSDSGPNHIRGGLLNESV